jgi:hypothetical protein
MSPTILFVDPQHAARHEDDLRAAAAQARFARMATRSLWIDGSGLPAARRWTLRYASEGSRV